MRLLFPKLAPDYFPVDRFNLTMTLRAGGSNIPPCNGGADIGMGKNVVRGVT